MQNAAEKLEFEAIKKKVLNFVKTELGREKVLSLGEFLSYEDLVTEKNLLQEMVYAHERFGNLPIETSSNLESYLSFAKKGGVLTEQNIEYIAHDIIINKNIQSYFKQFENENELRKIALSTAEMSFLEEKIHLIIAPDLSIFDTASPELRSIRSAIRKLTKDITKRVQTLVAENGEYLSSSVLTLRDGHYVLPVNTSYKSKVKGIIMDISHSGGTTFIEPEALVQMNNKMKELLSDEKEEIHRLLESLSREIGKNYQELKSINETIARLDFIEAKVRYGESSKGNICQLEKKPCVLLKNSRHPLINPEKVVPNDFTIQADTPIYIISGPNAGGKTIALKTVGLLVYMNECGLPIPADEESCLGYFKHVYVDIGDSQSISDSLSTFSGHMANLSDLLNEVGGNDLVLLDEVGTGTSPKEGESLAYAIVMQLKKKKAFALISSHFEGLKAAAMSEPGIKNASMRFDEETLSPTYRLIEGIPGDSYGLIVARRFGMNEEVMKLAEAKVAESTDLSVSEALRKLNDTSAELEKERLALAKERNGVLLEQKKLEESNEKVERRLRSLSDEINAAKEKELKEFKEKADKILSNLQGESLRKGDVTKAKNQLEELIEQKEEIKFDEPLKEGDYVLFPSLEVEGRIKAIVGNNVTLVSREGLTFQTKKDRLTKIAEPKEKVKPINGFKVDEAGMGVSVPLELNLIGMRAEPALSAIDQYLDKCRIKKYKRVRIIHGFGSGILRKVTREYLDKHKEFVDHYEGADAQEGAGGATIVYLK